MRLPEEKIKQGILHPEEEVRLTAVSYFAERNSRDESIMPLVIQAVENFGRDTAFRILRRADNLAQTETTAKWLVGELSREMDLEDVGNDNYCCAAAIILCHIPPGLLDPDMADLLNFPEELRPAFLERLEMAAWNWDQGWHELEDLGEEARELGDFRMRHVRRTKRIIETLAPHREHADEILQLLHRRYRGKSRSLMEWLERAIIELAGAMGLQEAIPILVERLHEDDWGVSDSAQTALQLIGSNEVVEELARQWANGSGDFRRGAAEVMWHIHTDLSVEKCLEFLADEREDDTRHFLANAVLDNFAAEAVEPVRQMVLGDWDDLTPDESDLRYYLVATATVMEATFPEYEQWYGHATKNRWGWHDHDRGRIRKNFREDADDDEEDWEEDEWDEALDDGYDSEDEDFGPYVDEEPPGLIPLRRDQERVGRNDPCPCGSGKKYKKCCIKKQNTPPKFPLGTIALYGPDDKTTTKIAASVIMEEGAEPILERWVGTDVKDNPKVRREIKEFLNKHGVKSVVATESNMGCPHEEGEDFPHGEDCPFCPWWKGKQGSGRQE